MGDNESEDEYERWPESVRVDVVGEKGMEGEGYEEQVYIIKAVRLLVVACAGLRVLELRNWKAREHSRWSREVFQSPVW